MQKQVQPARGLDWQGYVLQQGHGVLHINQWVGSRKPALPVCLVPVVGLLAVFTPGLTIFLILDDELLYCSVALGLAVTFAGG